MEAGEALCENPLADLLRFAAIQTSASQKMLDLFEFQTTLLFCAVKKLTL